MKIVSFGDYGGAEVLAISDVEWPGLVQGSVLVRVAAAGVNPADWRIRSGQFRRFLRVALPFVPGSDVAGVVESVGEGVSCFRPGDPVYAMLPIRSGGGYADFAAIPESLVVPAPRGIPLSEAASVPLAALTAL